jgi:hypothetical protein
MRESKQLAWKLRVWFSTPPFIGSSMFARRETISRQIMQDSAVLPVSPSIVVEAHDASGAFGHEDGRQSVGGHGNGR